MQIPQIQQTCSAIEASGIATWLRVEQPFAIPIVNAIHVICFGVVFGTILIVDLRLIGVASTYRPFMVIQRDYIRWTWVAFIGAAITGLAMFSANATTFCINTQFQLKMVVIVLAGINMLIFDFVTLRSVSEWDTAPRPPARVRLTGALSLLFWISVIVLGRWIGYTKGGITFDVPTDIPLGF